MEGECLLVLVDLADYGWVMMEGVRQQLEAGPFESFAIITSSGHRYEVPSADHAGISPKGNRVIIWFEDDSSVTISALHIAAVEKRASAKNGQG